MQDIRDRNDKVIKDGDNLERAIDGNGPIKGHKYRAEVFKWDKDDTEDSVVANGGYISEKLDPERAKEFMVVNEHQ